MKQDTFLLTKTLSSQNISLVKIKQQRLLFDPIDLLLLLLSLGLPLDVLIDLLSKLDQLLLQNFLIRLQMPLDPLVQNLLQIHYKKIIKFI